MSEHNDKTTTEAACPTQSALLCGGTSTNTNETDNTLTIEMLNEAIELVKALTPKKAPDDLFLIKGSTGLNIIKNEMIPENTIMVSKRLFDLIYDSSDT